MKMGLSCVVEAVRIASGKK